MQPVNVGILGSGDVGRALAKGFAGVGHDVKIGSRDPQKLAEFAAGAGARVSAGTFAEAAQFGDILVLATLGVATVEAIELAGIDAFDGKVVIDTTNPLDFSKGMPPVLSIGTTDSLGEVIQRRIPKARVVKAFNTVGNSLFVNPQLPGGPPDMFLCGNDEDAKKIVAQICDAFGWGVIDLGGIESSRYLEPMCLAWVLHGFRSGSWGHAFKMLRA
ncbi:MAG TPA: NAD(P)-binding domain-containing protein [Thermoanaerobaculia bacterium]|nr:NAD(P)-binding domain-containing protein [Thermoanaerobaculia bacterium]